MQVGACLFLRACATVAAAADSARTIHPFTTFVNALFANLLVHRTIRIAEEATYMPAKEMGAGVMYIQLGAYLSRLESEERGIPEGKRRQVPTMRELAAAVGINPATLSKLERGKIKSLNFEIGAAILDELNRRGFDTTPNDIIAYRRQGAMRASNG
jgi:DNA-binding Xre family transcriptional regulator